MRITQILTKSIIISLICTFFATGPAFPCTSMIVGAKASASGRPLLWKNRDTGNQHNFVSSIPADKEKGTYAYVAIFNAGDSLLREAWMGMNSEGFAIMNTASYNLAPDTAKLVDQEGVVMSRALQVCRTVKDFENLLDTLPKPLGVQANFGVIDAQGNGGYFETDDYTYKPFYLADTDNDVIVRTNFSVSGNDTDGMGYIRCVNAQTLLADKIEHGGFVPEDFTEVASRSFYNSLMEKDMEADTAFRWVVDQDFIPRHSTSASAVIEGIAPGSTAPDPIMWTMMGYPPTAHVQAVWVDKVPAGLQPSLPGWKSPDSEESLRLRDQYAFPIHRGSGQRYVDMNYIRQEQQRQRLLSREGYRQGRSASH